VYTVRAPIFAWCYAVAPQKTRLQGIKLELICCRAGTNGVELKQNQNVKFDRNMGDEKYREEDR